MQLEACISQGCQGGWQVSWLSGVSALSWCPSGLAFFLQIQIWSLPHGFILGPRLKRQQCPGEGLLREVAEAQKRHTETHDASESLGLEMVTTTSSTHQPKQVIEPSPRARGSKPLLSWKQWQSHIQAKTMDTRRDTPYLSHPLMSMERMLSQTMEKS